MAHFIGKTISLISKADIRYVGVLHEINSKESTVSLRNVRSYGTEGRVPGNDLPASDHIYEYIVFRGSDVKDLTVSDPVSTPAPAPASAPAQSNDPSVTQQRPIAQQQQQQQQSSLTAPSGSQQGYASYMATRPTPGSFGNSLTSNTPLAADSVSTPPAIGSVNQNPLEKNASSFSFTSTNTVQSPVSDSQTPVAQSAESKTTYPSQSFTPSPASESSTTNPPLSTQPSSSANTADLQSPAVASAESTLPTASQATSSTTIPSTSTPTGNNPRGPPTQPRPTQPHGQQSFGTRQHHQGPRNNPVPQSIDGDFDFAEMNAKFSKTDIAKEIASEEGAPLPPTTGESVIPKKPKETFYDRKSSFFDNISSTTKERIEGVEERPRRGDERRLNVETFGSDYVYKNSRGGYRGNRRGGPSGGYRGNRNSYGNGGYNGNNSYRGGNNGGYYGNSGNSGYRRNNGGDSFENSS